MGFSIWIVFINLNNVVHFLVGSKCHSFNSETRGLSLQPINLWFELCVTERHCLVLDIRLISRGGCVPRLCLFSMQSETRPQRAQLCGCPAKLKCVSFLFCPSTIGQKGRAILLKIAEWNLNSNLDQIRCTRLSFAISRSSRHHVCPSSWTWPKITIQKREELQQME